MAPLILLVYWCCTSDIINRNSVLEVWCQQDSSQLKNFSENSCRVNYGSFLELYNLCLNSHFFSFLCSLLSAPITTRISSTFHGFFSSLVKSRYFSIFSFFFFNYCYYFKNIIFDLHLIYNCWVTTDDWGQAISFFVVVVCP